MADLLNTDQDTLTFKEATGDGTASPTVIGFTPEGGRVTAMYLLQNPPGEDGADPEPVTLEQLQAAVEELLGSTAIPPGDGRLTRALPLAHPMFPFLYVSAINSIQGVGTPTLVAAEEGLEAPPLPYYAAWPAYWFKLEFCPRPYSLLQDYNIEVDDTDTYYADDDTGEGDGVPYTYANEWIRYTDYGVQPQANFLTAQQGQMCFRTAGGGDPGGNMWPGSPRMYLPDSLLTVNWYQVPYRYVTSPNSYLARFQGLINQAPWWDWGAGELLYLNHNATRYQPPVPESYAWYDGTFSTAKLCNVEINFLLTRRTGTAVPTPTNRSHIPAGHNLLPWLQTRKFYYGTVGVFPVPADDNNLTPSFLSFPASLLFTDPDTAQP